MPWFILDIFPFNKFSKLHKSPNFGIVLIKKLLMCTEYSGLSKGSGYETMKRSHFINLVLLQIFSIYFLSHSHIPILN